MTTQNPEIRLVLNEKTNNKPASRPPYEEVVFHALKNREISEIPVLHKTAVANKSGGEEILNLKVR